MVEKTRFVGSSQPSCMKCRYFDTITDLISGKSAHICRFDPPKVFAMPGMASPGQITWIQQTFWPAVAASDWCSHHTSSETVQ